MRLFGNAPAAQAVSPAESIKKLRATVEMLEKREVRPDATRAPTVARRRFLRSVRGERCVFVCVFRCVRRARAQQHLERKANDEVVEAKKKLATKNRRGAMMCLKRKKAYEAQIGRLSGARMTIEEQVLAIESANVNLEAMNAMREGAKTMKSIHKNM